MAEKYVNNEKNIQFLLLKTSIEVRVAYTLFYNIFQVFDQDDNCPNKIIYHTLTLFSKKSEESIADIVKQPVNFINKSKSYVKKKINKLEKEHPAFSQFNLEKLDSFAGDSCQKLGSTKDVLIHFENNCLLFKKGQY